MNRIPVTEATREELLAAIQSVHHYPDQLERMEREIHHGRVQAALADMKRAGEDSGQWAGKDSRKFNEAIDRFDKVNARLRELQSS